MGRKAHELQLDVRPDFELGSRVLRSVDLFCGCGGLSLGLALACREFDLALDVQLAVDAEPDAVAVFARNFPKASPSVSDVTSLFNGMSRARMTAAERAIVEATGPVDVLLGGPPCQGNSNLNNRTRRNDPKNALYARMARAAEVLRPKIVLIENVPSVVLDRASVVDSTAADLRLAGYTVAATVVSLLPLGVAQRRRRHVMLAVEPGIGVDPEAVLRAVARLQRDRDLRWAMGDLRVDSASLFDSPSRATAVSQARMAWLHAHDEYDLPNRLRPVCHQDDHSYKAMYGRLRWDEPAQTLTSGFGSMGQGRYVHPAEQRTLTPHEAARIQGFPDYFCFDDVRRRGALATMIGNAVPPQLTQAVFRCVLEAWVPPAE
jgi:DNA (cytosine-5)-methyltransferase 1